MVCIPVYGAVDAVRRVLVKRARPHPQDVRFWSPMTPVPTPRSALRNLARRRAQPSEVTYLRQPENVGFAGNVNSAFAAAAPADVVVLNSDCVVAAGWLEGLREPRTRTRWWRRRARSPTTARSSSVPDRNQPQSQPAAGRSLADAAAARAAPSPRLYPRLPTAIGHCMLVRRGRSTSSAASTTSSRPATARRSTSRSAACCAAWSTWSPTTSGSVTTRGGSFGARRGEPRPGGARADHDARYPYYQRAATASRRLGGRPLARAIGAARRALGA